MTMTLPCLVLAVARTVVFEPCGEVTFTNVPARAFVSDANYAELVALSGRKVTACIARGARYDRCVFWERLPGFSPTDGVTATDLSALPGEGAFAFDRELFCLWRPDVIHIDPLLLGRVKGWGPEKVADVRTRVAPFFANRFSRDWSAPRECPGYRFYSIPEIAEKMAVAYACTNRMARLLDVVARTERAIAARIGGLEPPRVLLVYGSGKAGSVVPFRLNRGNGQAQYRALRAKDALEGCRFRTYGDGGAAGGTIDFETILTLDPDVIVVAFAGAMRPGDPMHETFRDFLRQKDHPVARHVRAFRNGRVYPGGTPLQGPLVYLFQLEMAAKQLYPQAFGPWRPDGGYPAAERLFDREAVVKILTER